MVTALAAYSPNVILTISFKFTKKYAHVPARIRHIDNVNSTLNTMLVMVVRFWPGAKYKPSPRKYSMFDRKTFMFEYDEFHAMSMPFYRLHRRPCMSFKCTASDDYNDWQLGRLNRTYHDGWQIKFWATQFSLITRKRLIDTKLNDNLIQLNNLGFSTKNWIFNFVCYNFGHTPNNGKQSLPTHKILDVFLSSPI